MTIMIPKYNCIHGLKYLKISDICHQKNYQILSKIYKANLVQASNPHFWALFVMMACRRWLILFILYFCNDILCVVILLCVVIGCLFLNVILCVVVTGCLFLSDILCIVVTGSLFLSDILCIVVTGSLFLNDILCVVVTGCLFGMESSLHSGPAVRQCPGDGGIHPPQWNEGSHGEHWHPNLYCKSTRFLLSQC